MPSTTALSALGIIIRLSADFSGDYDACKTYIDKTKAARFLLRVDGQTKRSFSGKEPAMTAGGAIKKVFPVVVVAIEDTADGIVEVVKA